MPTGTTVGLCVIRSAYGAAALAAPQHLRRALGDPVASRADRAVLRVLGARHVLQAALTLRRPGAGTLAAGTGVDALHALSMAALARGSDERRAAASRDAAVAGTLALLGAGCVLVARAGADRRG